MLLIKHHPSPSHRSFSRAHQTLDYSGHCFCAHLLNSHSLFVEGRAPTPAPGLAFSAASIYLIKVWCFARNQKYTESYSGCEVSSAGTISASFIAILCTALLQWGGFGCIFCPAFCITSRFKGMLPTLWDKFRAELPGQKYSEFIFAAENFLNIWTMTYKSS